jgi:hypothetical protein
MNNGKTIGMLLFFGGIIAIIVYGLILGFNEIIQSFDLISGILTILIIIGFLVLLISIVIEQRKDTKETMKNVNKEDLKP